MLSQPLPSPDETVLNPVAECLAALAGTPDDSSWIEPQLVALAGLAADLVPSVDSASVTAYRTNAWATVGHSTDTVAAVDTAQYVVQAGPTFAALDIGRPVTVPDIADGTIWPRFDDVATRLGLRTVLCVPLFAGRGTTMAVLNLYGTDPATMAPVTAAVRATYDGRPLADRPDPGTTALVAGITEAFGVRTRIQQALRVIAADTHRATDTAYLLLRVRAAETGVSLRATAAAVLEEHRYATAFGA